MSARELFALIKPRITAMAVAVAGAALLLAPAGETELGLAGVLVALAGIGLLVGAANALNMYLCQPIGVQQSEGGSTDHRNHSYSLHRPGHGSRSSRVGRPGGPNRRRPLGLRHRGSTNRFI